MKVEFCDGGCGARSPTLGDGLHASNHWVEISVLPRLSKRKQTEYLFCLTCFKRVQAALEPLLVGGDIPRKERPMTPFVREVLLPVVGWVIGGGPVLAVWVGLVVAFLLASSPR